MKKEGRGSHSLQESKTKIQVFSNPCAITSGFDQETALPFSPFLFVLINAKMADSIVLEVKHHAQVYEMAINSRTTMGQFQQ